METKHCKACGVSYPKTPDFFYQNKRTQRYSGYCKSCTREKAKVSARKNPQRHNQNGARWRRKVGIPSLSDRYRIENGITEKRCPGCRQWRQYPEGFSSRGRRCRHCVNEAAKAYHANRKAKKLAVGGAYGRSDIKLMLKTQGSKCWWCGAVLDEGEYEVDHRIPLSRGGSNKPSNLCISCKTCNRKKSAKLPQEWNGRLL